MWGSGFFSPGAGGPHPPSRFSRRPKRCAQGVRHLLREGHGDRAAELPVAEGRGPDLRGHRRQLHDPGRDRGPRGELQGRGVQQGGKRNVDPGDPHRERPPTITAGPESQSACVGASVLFTVSATGTAPLSYQWKRNGADIPGATTAVLTLSPVAEAHVGTYTVVVTNACGSATSTPATLSLQAPPASPLGRAPRRPARDNR